MQNIVFFYRALLKKRPIILRSLLIVATPYAADLEHQLSFKCTILNDYGADFHELSRADLEDQPGACGCGVASVSRIDKNIGLFCKRAL